MTTWHGNTMSTILSFSGRNSPQRASGVVSVCSLFLTWASCWRSRRFEKPWPKAIWHVMAKQKDEMYAYDVYRALLMSIERNFVKTVASSKKQDMPILYYVVIRQCIPFITYVKHAWQTEPCCIEGPKHACWEFGNGASHNKFDIRHSSTMSIVGETKPRHIGTPQFEC